ncbi:hypothetical protein [Nocardia sp. NBC_01009]|uniref:hypothetical protein n=1 Tax=Nocardia sp. NBC_01009 TaxID=2975996 RepID=UPI00386A4345|nr:hypothetical protein OHA42_27175 [Nocardia sp. NBC_01009]
MNRLSIAVRIVLSAGLLTAGAQLAACSGNGEPDLAPATPTTNSISISIPAPSGSSGAPNTDEITPAAATQLCDMIRPEAGTWRDEGTMLGKISFNGTVHNWAARNGGLNDVVIADRKIIDTITLEHCPDVRQQVLDALDIPDLASGLAGFN